MEKRLLVAVAISIGILLLWSRVFSPSPPPPPPSQAPATEATKPADGGGTAAAPAVAPPAPTAATPGAAPPPASAEVRPAEELVTLESAEAKFEFSSHGASLRQIKLKDRQFLLDRTRPDTGMQIVTTSTEATAPLRTSFTGHDFAWSDKVAWSVTRPAPDAVVFRAETPEVTIEKRFALEPQRYRLRMTVAVENKRAKEINGALLVHLYAAQDPQKKGGGFFDYATANLTEMVCYVNGKAQRATVEALAKEAPHRGEVRWAAAGDKFFTIAVAPFPETPLRDRDCKQRALDATQAEVALVFSSRTVEQGKTSDYVFEVFAGPKVTSDLEAVAPGGQDARLADVVDVTFAVLSRPMLALLKQFHRLTGNWGIAIILLTIVVRLITFYPTHRTLVSAKKMQALSGKIADLRKKLGDDKQKLGVETMNLYKAHGVSPFGGCLPSLIQMPIWIALFSTLNYAVELYHSSFFWYITDLSAKDPYYLAPLLMGAVMFIQMRMSPAGTDPQQQKMMAIMMPVMFTGFSLFLPAGLSIYTLTSYLIGILQQVYVNRRYRRKPLAMAKT
jgi:YidC/Oxa1 family membrane protein insertase